MRPVATAPATAPAPGNYTHRQVDRGGTGWDDGEGVRKGESRMTSGLCCVLYVSLVLLLSSCESHRFRLTTRLVTSDFLPPSPLVRPQT